MNSVIHTTSNQPTDQVKANKASEGFLFFFDMWYWPDLCWAFMSQPTFCLGRVGAAGWYRLLTLVTPEGRFGGLDRLTPCWILTACCFTTIIFKESFAAFLECWLLTGSIVESLAKAQRVLGRVQTLSTLPSAVLPNLSYSISSQPCCLWRLPSACFACTASCRWWLRWPAPRRSTWASWQLTSTAFSLAFFCLGIR